MSEDEESGSKWGQIETLAEEKEDDASHPLPHKKSKGKKKRGKATRVRQSQTAPKSGMFLESSQPAGTSDTLTSNVAPSNVAPRDVEIMSEEEPDQPVDEDPETLPDFHQGEEPRQRDYTVHNPFGKQVRNVRAAGLSKSQPSQSEILLCPDDGVGNEGGDPGPPPGWGNDDPENARPEPMLNPSHMTRRDEQPAPTRKTTARKQNKAQTGEKKAPRKTKADTTDPDYTEDQGAKRGGQRGGKRGGKRKGRAPTRKAAKKPGRPRKARLDVESLADRDDDDGVDSGYAAYSQQGARKKRGRGDRKAEVPTTEDLIGTFANGPVGPPEINPNGESVRLTILERCTDALDHYVDKARRFREAIARCSEELYGATKEYLETDAPSDDYANDSFETHLNQLLQVRGDLEGLGYTPTGQKARTDEHNYKQFTYQLNFAGSALYQAKNFQLNLNAILGRNETSPRAFQSILDETMFYEESTKPLLKHVVLDAVVLLFERLKWKRCGTHIYRPHVLKNGQETPAWIDVGRTIDALWKAVKPEQYKQLYGIIFAKSWAKDIATHIEEGRTRIAEIKWDQGVTVWRNGVYIGMLTDCREPNYARKAHLLFADVWFDWKEWNQVRKTLPEINAIKFHDSKFAYDPRINISNFHTNITTSVDIIFNNQGYTLEEQQPIYAEMGRQLMPKHLLDRKEVAQIFAGAPGKGKSTIISLIAHYFPESMRFLMTSSRAERSLAPIVQNNILWFANPEVIGYPFSKQDMKAMVTPGEACSGMILYANNFSQVIKATFCLAWNELPSLWRSPIDDMARRSFVIILDRDLQFQRFNIAERVIASEYGLLVRKMFLAFQWFLKYGDEKNTDSFWDLVPPKFIKMRNELYAQDCPLKRWIKSALVPHKNAYIPITLLQKEAALAIKRNPVNERVSATIDDVVRILKGLGYSYDAKNVESLPWPVRVPRPRGDAKGDVKGDSTGIDDEENRVPRPLAEQLTDTFVKGVYLSTNKTYFKKKWVPKITAEHTQEEHEALVAQKTRIKDLARVVKKRNSVFSRIQPFTLAEVESQGYDAWERQREKVPLHSDDEDDDVREFKEAKRLPGNSQRQSREEQKRARPVAEEPEEHEEHVEVPDVEMGDEIPNEVPDEIPNEVRHVEADSITVNPELRRSAPRIVERAPSILSSQPLTQPIQTKRKKKRIAISQEEAEEPGALIIPGTQLQPALASSQLQSQPAAVQSSQPAAVQSSQPAAVQSSQPAVQSQLAITGTPPRTTPSTPSTLPPRRTSSTPSTLPPPPPRTPSTPFTLPPTPHSPKEPAKEPAKQSGDSSRQLSAPLRLATSPLLRSPSVELKEKTAPPTSEEPPMDQSQPRVEVWTGEDVEY